jgi:hypothetical protein
LGWETCLILTPGRCDGIVGALNLNLTARQLAQTTPDPVKVNCPGTDSPIGCGSNPNYDLYYVVASPPPPPVIVTVPNPLRQSPERARQLIEEAGLFLRTTEEKFYPGGRARGWIVRTPARVLKLSKGRRGFASMKKSVGTRHPPLPTRKTCLSLSKKPAQRIHCCKPLAADEHCGLRMQVLWAFWRWS